MKIIITNNIEEYLGLETEPGPVILVDDVGEVVEFSLKGDRFTTPLPSYYAQFIR